MFVRSHRFDRFNRFDRSEKRESLDQAGMVSCSRVVELLLYLRNQEGGRDREAEREDAMWRFAWSACVLLCRNGPNRLNVTPCTHPTDDMRPLLMICDINIYDIPISGQTDPWSV